MINIQGLTKKYNSVSAVNNVSFQIEKGEILGFLGPNGAGKSTTMKMLTGYLEPTAGSILINDDDVVANAMIAKKKIGYLPENTPLYSDMTVEEFLQYSSDMQGVAKEQTQERMAFVLDRCGLKEKKYAEIQTLSKGYKQRVGLASALISDPEILVLDEPTSGLDPNQVVEIRNLIKEIAREKTIILSSHILSEVEATCSRVLIIHKGSIVAQGTPDELRSQASGRSLIRIVVQNTDQNVAEILKTLNGVDAVKSTIGKGEAEQMYDVEVASTSDLRKEIVNTLASKNIQLLEITRQRVSLEDIFSQLTNE